MSEIVRISKHDQELIEAYRTYRIKTVMESYMNDNMKSNIVKSIENETISEQIHFIINQICIDNYLA